MTDWRADPRSVAPTVLVLGGFLTSPPLYHRLARRLRERGASGVVVAPVWTPDWLLAAGRGLGAVVARAGRALAAASELAGRSERSRGTPVLVVGHSAGGLVARLLTSPVPFAGRRLGAHRRVGAIVTLGTPHDVSRAGLVGGGVGWLATTFARETVPGAFFAPEVGYVAVGSRAVTSGRRGLLRGWFADPFYRRLHPAPDGTPIEGDGLVPLACTELPGARRVVLEGILHGQLSLRAWYGSREAVDVWWPVALDAWRDALEARTGRGGMGRGVSA